MPGTTPPAFSLWRSAILAQVLGSLVAAALIELAWPRLWSQPLAVALIQGSCAALASYKLEAPPWWLAIHLAFAPLVVMASALSIAPLWYLAAFILLLLTFWRTDKGRVPLYLSNAATATAVADLLPPHPCHVADLGCGNGGFLRRLALVRPDCEFLGIEHAPLPWLWACLSTFRLPNVHIRYGDFWSLQLGLFDLVYAFLSPAPMPQLWEKAQGSMREDAVLVSNSFAIPAVEPLKIIDVPDRRATRLYLYRPGDGK